MGIKLRTLKPLIRKGDFRTIKPEAKKAEPFYLSPEYRAWRETVVARAGRRCQDVDERTGRRCSKAEPHHRMFADHVVEVRDGGDRFDPVNGRCRCGSHHTFKTIAARAARLAAPSSSRPGG